jgi:hypothetical protein
MLKIDKPKWNRYSLGTTSQRSSTAYFAGTKNISRHEGIL